MVAATPARVELLDYTNKTSFVNKIRVCRTLDFEAFSDDVVMSDVAAIDLALINRIACRSESPLEHMVYSFKIGNISAVALSHLVRHRMASYSVQSSRITLRGRLTNNSVIENFIIPACLTDAKERQLLKDYYETVIKLMLSTGFSNDMMKYLLPGGFFYSLYLTINARSFLNLYTQRQHRAAHWEIRRLVIAMSKEIERILGKELALALLGKRNTGNTEKQNQS